MKSKLFPKVAIAIGGIFSLFVLIAVITMGNDEPETEYRGVHPGVSSNRSSTGGQTRAIPAEHENDRSTLTEGFPVTVTDTVGRELTFDAPPERIICLTTACVHNLAVFDMLPLGAHSDNINISLDPLVFGEGANEITSITFTDSWDVEQMLELNPDLLIISTFDEYLIDVMDDWVSIYVTTTNQADYGMRDFTTELMRYGAFLGREVVADAFIEGTNDRIAAYEARVDTLESATMIITGALPDANEFWIPPSCGIVMERLVNCLGGGGEGWTQTTSEGLLAFDPDVLVIQDWGLGSSLEGFAAVPLWNELAAVREDRVYLISASSTLDYSLLSIANSIDVLMPLAYPDVFSAPLNVGQVREILAEAETG